MKGSRDHTTESSERIQSKSADLIKWQKWPTDDSTVMPPWKRENPDNLRSCPVACSISLKMEDGILYCFPQNHYINRRREEFLFTIYLIIHSQYFSFDPKKLGFSWVGSPRTRERHLCQEQWFRWTGRWDCQLAILSSFSTEPTRKWRD